MARRTNLLVVVYFYQYIGRSPNPIHHNLWQPSQIANGEEDPKHSSTFIPVWSYLLVLQKKDRELKEHQKTNYDHHHLVRSQEVLPPEETVWAHIQDQTDPGCVIGPSSTPRSYLIQTPSGIVHRNQFHITPHPAVDNSENGTQSECDTNRDHVTTRSQTGMRVSPPPRLTYWRGGDAVSDWLTVLLWQSVVFSCLLRVCSIVSTRLQYLLPNMVSVIC